LVYPHPPLNSGGFLCINSGILVTHPNPYKDMKEKDCGCKEPKMLAEDSGFTITRIMCKKHAEEYQESLKQSCKLKSTHITKSI